MGAGKTATAATAAGEALDDFMVRNVLIVGPLKVAAKTWPDEFKLWSHLSHFKVSVIVGDAAERTVAAEAEADFHVVNFENFAWLVEQYTGRAIIPPKKPSTPRRRKDESDTSYQARLADHRRDLEAHRVSLQNFKRGKAIGRNRWKWDLVIWDESNVGLSSHDTTMFYAAKGLRKLTNVPVVELTGTPAPNGYGGLWGQVFLLDNGKRLGENITAFRSRFMEQDRWTKAWKVRPEAPAQIDKLIADKIMVIESYAGLPELVEHEDYIDMPPAVAQLYDEFARTCVLELGETQITADVAAALSNKLLQFANGFVYDAHGKPHWVHDLKLDALEQAMDEAAGQPVLCSYVFRPDVDRIMKRIKCAKVIDARGSLIDEWNDRKIPLLLCHPKSAGHGLNLQDGGNITVSFGLSWSLGLHQQFLARLRRQGQKAPTVFARHLLLRGSWDTRVAEALQRKEATQDNLISSVKQWVTAMRT